jgi:putative heme iron utilization protein
MVGQGDMTGDKLGKRLAEGATGADPASAARLLVRGALKASLGTLDRRSGHPYTSLVIVATEADGTPVFLISRLAVHTQNLEADARASLLVDGTGVSGDPLAGGRVTLVGRAEPTQSAAAKGRFLARHPHAERYADFPDFAFYALTLERAHFVGGFGRIVDLAPRDLLLDLEGAEALLAAEADIVAHMNEDHAGALELYATVLCGAPGGPWRMAAIDPEGCDIVCDGEARRVSFATRVLTPADARQELVRLAAEARSRAAAT